MLTKTFLADLLLRVDEHRAAQLLHELGGLLLEPLDHVARALANGTSELLLRLIEGRELGQVLSHERARVLGGLRDEIDDLLEIAGRRLQCLAVDGGPFGQDGRFATTRRGPRTTPVTERRPHHFLATCWRPFLLHGDPRRRGPGRLPSGAPKKKGRLRRDCDLIEGARAPANAETRAQSSGPTNSSCDAILMVRVVVLTSALIA